MTTIFPQLQDGSQYVHWQRRMQAALHSKGAFYGTVVSKILDPALQTYANGLKESATMQNQMALKFAAMMGQGDVKRAKPEPVQLEESETDTGAKAEQGATLGAAAAARTAKERKRDFWKTQVQANESMGDLAAVQRRLQAKTQTGTDGESVYILQELLRLDDESAKWEFMMGDPGLWKTAGTHEALASNALMAAVEGKFKHLILEGATAALLWDNIEAFFCSSDPSRRRAANSAFLQLRFSSSETFDTFVARVRDPAEQLRAWAWRRRPSTCVKPS